MVAISGVAGLIRRLNSIKDVLKSSFEAANNGASTLETCLRAIARLAGDEVGGNSRARKAKRDQQERRVIEMRGRCLAAAKAAEDMVKETDDDLNTTKSRKSNRKIAAGATSGASHGSTDTFGPTGPYSLLSSDSIRLPPLPKIPDSERVDLRSEQGRRTSNRISTKVRRQANRVEADGRDSNKAKIVSIYAFGNISYRG